MTEMGILNRLKCKTLLDETHIYETFEKWFGEDAGEVMVELKARIANAEGDYKRELIKEYWRKDFLKPFIVMCDLTYQNIGTKERKIKNIIGYVIGAILYETTDIKKLNENLKELEKNHSKEFKGWIKDGRYGRVWILDTFLDRTIEKVLSQKLKEDDVEVIPNEWRITYGEAAKYDFAQFSGASLAEVESMLAYGISRTYLHNILYGFIMLRLLIDALKDDLYITWLGDEDLFTGYSRVDHFFDGIIILEEKDRENPWLLKCISTYYNPSDAIESIETKLDDIGVRKCILFVPTYPSQNALRYSIYTHAKKKHEIIILYLHDLYRMIKMNKDDAVREYLRGRRIR